MPPFYEGCVIIYYIYSVVCARRRWTPRKTSVCPDKRTNIGTGPQWTLHNRSSSVPHLPPTTSPPAPSPTTSWRTWLPPTSVPLCLIYPPIWRPQTNQSWPARPPQISIGEWVSEVLPNKDMVLQHMQFNYGLRFYKLALLNDSLFLHIYYVYFGKRANHHLIAMAFVERINYFKEIWILWRWNSR